MVTRRSFLAIAGVTSAVGIATIAGIQLLPGEEKPTGDPVIKFGKENCVRCRMTISDARFASAWRETNGTEKHFDDIGCMVLQRGETGVSDDSRFWVHDYETEEWTDAVTASYVVSQQILTPMSYGVAALKSPANAETLAHHLGTATVAQWQDLDDSIAERA